MKKIIITFLMCCPLMCAAQSEWEAPVTNQNNVTKEVKDTAKKSHKAEAKKKTIDAKNIKDWKYIQKGAVPEIEGKVVFTHDVDVNGKNAQEIYDIVYATLDSLTKKPEQINSSIALINRKAHSIVARYQEWLEFSKSFISLDRTKMSYIIIANCSDNKLHMTLERIRRRPLNRTEDFCRELDYRQVCCQQERHQAHPWFGKVPQEDHRPQGQDFPVDRQRFEVNKDKQNEHKP